MIRRIDGHSGTDRHQRGLAMSDPERTHTAEPAEGADPPGQDTDTGRTPRTEEPAEGEQLDQPGADTPDAT